MKRLSSPWRLGAGDILAAIDGDHSDGHRLLLRVRGSSASWIYRYTSPITGRRREIGLGSARRDDRDAAAKAAAQARADALENESKLLKRSDPMIEIESRKQEQREKAEAHRVAVALERRTLGRSIREYHENEIEGSAKFTKKYKAQWVAAFENHLKPYKGGALWHKPIADITPIELLDFFKDLQRKLPHTSRKARQRLDAVFEHGKLHSWCVHRPTQAIVRAIKKSAPSMKNKSHRALSYRDAPAFFERLRTLDSTASKCLQFTVLTWARTNESINAQWSEFDLGNGIWLIPPERMKTEEAHRVDLSPEALAILRNQRGKDERWVFPSPRGNGRPISSMGMLMALRRLEVAKLTTVHGLARQTASTWAHETHAATPNAIEAALSHREHDLVAAAYNKANFFAERKELLAAWGRFLIGLPVPSNIVEFITRDA
jgi:integrase